MLTFTIGETIDKLAVIHLKIWHLEEKVQEESKKDPKDEKKLEEYFDAIVSLNKKRMEIIKVLDEYFEKDGK